MLFDKDFDELLKDLEITQEKLLKRLQSQVAEILQGIKNGEIKGTFETRQIDELGMKGYVFRGYFGSDKAFDPLEPLKPLTRRPLPEKPFEVRKNDLKEMREPLTDIFEEDNTIRVYVETPGEEKNDLKVSLKEENLEIRGKSFYKKVELPTRNLAVNALSSEYKNGLLTITVPKKAKIRDEDKTKAKSV